MNGRKLGKTAAQETAIAELIRKYPNAVIVRISTTATIIEKPVVGQLLEVCRGETK